MFSGLLQNRKRARANDEQNTSTSSLFRMSIANSTESLMNKSSSSINSNNDDSSFENVVEDDRQAPKRLALQDSNIPRYEKEFVELSLIGMYILEGHRNF